MNQHSQATQAVNLFSIIFPVQEIFLFLQTNDFPFNLMPIRLPAALRLSMVMVKLISAAVKFFSYLTVDHDDRADDEIRSKIPQNRRGNVCSREGA